MFGLLNIDGFEIKIKSRTKILNQITSSAEVTD